MSRPILTGALILCLGGAAFAADPAPAPAAPHEAKAVNKLDPVSGKHVKEKAKTVSVKLDGKEVVIGFANDEDAEKVAKADAKTQEIYAKAASEGKLVKDGKIVDAPKAEHK